MVVNVAGKELRRRIERRQRRRRRLGVEELLRRADADDDAQNRRQRRNDEPVSQAASQPVFWPPILLVLKISELVVVDGLLSVPEEEAENGDGDGLHALEAGVDDDDDVADDLAEPEVGEPLGVQERKFAQSKKQLVGKIF